MTTPTRRKPRKKSQPTQPSTPGQWIGWLLDYGSLSGTCRFTRHRAVAQAWCEEFNTACVKPVTITEQPRKAKR